MSKRRSPRASRRPGDGPARWLHPSVREVHRDSVLWALDKPAGVLSHPNRPGRASNALLRLEYDASREVYSVPGSPAGGEAVVHLVHRLDLETSGLILCTFDGEAASILKEDLFHHELVKEYRALLLGSLRQERGEWADHLRREARGRRVDVRTVARREPNAWTEYRLLETLSPAGASLVSLRPRSGRTHQLRVQSAGRSLPIAGDARYGDFTANRFLASRTGLRHMFLHACRLELRHPSTGHPMTLVSDPGRRLTEPLERLRELRERVPRRRQGR